MRLPLGCDGQGHRCASVSAHTPCPSQRLLAAQVFAQAGLASPVVGSIVVGAVNTGGTLLAASLIDRAGRRTLLLTSHIAMAVCLAALAAANLLPGALSALHGLCCTSRAANDVNMLECPQLRQHAWPVGLLCWRYETAWVHSMGMSYRK